MAENRLAGSIGWRKSRSMKLTHQYKSGGAGGGRISDRVRAGSEDWDNRSKSFIDKGVKARARTSVADMLLLKRSGML
jgi:hypothetical protein